MTQPASGPSAESVTKEEIASAAAEVAAAADELAVSIRAIEDYLDRRNIGVPAWVTVKGWENPGEDYWSRELGYELLNGSWHIAIRETSGHHQSEDQDRVHLWAFNRAPRKSRISCAAKIPDLLQELIKEAARTARRLRETTAQVNAFASTLNIAPTAKKVKK